MRMKLKVVDTVAFRQIVETVGEFMDEANFLLDNEGMKLRGVEESRVALLDMFLPKAFFQSYELDGGESDYLTLKSEEIGNILKKVKKGDIITINVDEKLMKMELDGEFLRTYEIPSLKSKVSGTPTINVQYPFKARMLTQSFNELIDQFNVITDVIELKGGEGKLTVKGETEMMNMEMELSLENGLLLECEGSEGMGRYGMEYLSKLVKVSNASDVVNIMLGGNVPLKIDYELAGGGHLDIYLAPRAD